MAINKVFLLFLNIILFSNNLYCMDHGFTVDLSCEPFYDQKPKNICFWEEFEEDRILRENAPKYDQVVHLNIRNNPFFGDERIKKFVNLYSLNLSGHTKSVPTFKSTVTDEGLKELTSIKKLILGGNDIITDKGIQNLTRLEHLQLPDHQMTLDSLKNLKSLQYLDLGKTIPDKTFIEGLTNFEKLQTLDLGYGMWNLGYVIDSNLLEGLSQLTKLKELSLGLYTVIDFDACKNIRVLSSLTNLTKLNGKTISSKDDFLKHLNDLTDEWREAYIRIENETEEDVWLGPKSPVITAVRLWKEMESKP